MGEGFTTTEALERRIADLEAELASARAEVEGKARRMARLEAQLEASRAIQPASPGGRLDTLLALSAALLVTREVEAIMRLVVEESVKRFPGVSGALVYLLDPASQTLMLSSPLTAAFVGFATWNHGRYLRTSSQYRAPTMKSRAIHELPRPGRPRSAFTAHTASAPTTMLVADWSPMRL